MLSSLDEKCCMLTYCTALPGQQSLYTREPALLCCGSGMFFPDPGSEFFPSRIQGHKDPRIRIRVKEFKYFLTQKLFQSSRKNDLGC
jgi:hypothetical protein